MKTGDLVHVTADGYYFGLGLITDVQERPASYRVLTADGKNIFYFSFELRPV